MRRSVNETAALVLKAARGAGAPLGVAEDLAFAAAHLEASALAELAAGLTGAAGRGALCDLCAALDARACGGDAALPQTALARALAAAWADAPPPAGGGPREVPDPIWAALDRLAQRTYVPATAASRATGAGAGLDDND